MRKKLEISIDENLLKMVMERAEEKKLTRSSYIRSLILKDLNNMIYEINKKERRKK